MKFWKQIAMKSIAAYEHSTWAKGLKRLQTRLQTHLQRAVLCGVVALAGLLGAGQALAASSPPFVDHGDGTVTDTSTGLMWDQCADGLSGNGVCTTGSAATYTWANALGLAATQNAANYKDYSDWRLPSIVELQTLVKTGVGLPFIDAAAFPNTPASYFWSGSSLVPYPVGAWYVGFVDGVTYNSFKAGAIYVRLVRGGQYFGSFALLPGGVSGITATAATLSATSPVDATGYWVVVPRAATAPTPAQVIAGVSYSSVTVAAAGTGAMTGKTLKTFFVNGLAAGTVSQAAGSRVPCISMASMNGVLPKGAGLARSAVQPWLITNGLISGCRSRRTCRKAEPLGAISHLWQFPA